MKMKMVFIGLLVALFALNTLPVQATDFSGYVKASYMTEWKRQDARWQFVVPPSYKMRKEISQFWIENVAEYPLTEAIYVIRVIEVVLYDADHNVVQSITDPAEIAQVVRLENSDETWQGNYVIWLGTIPPGHSKRCMFNWWYGELLASAEYGWGIYYEYSTWQGVWYLP
jgi:hypothetical protein